MNFEFKVRFSDNKLSLALFSVSAFLILIDASIARTYHFTPHSSPYDTYVFFTLFVLFSISLFLIFLYIREKSFKIIQKLRSRFKLLTYVTYCALFLSMFFVLLVLVQIVSISKYNTHFLMLSLVLNYSLAVFMLALLSYNFIIWFKNMKSYTILLYAISGILLSANVLSVLLYSYDMLSNLPVEIKEHRAYITPNPNSTLVLAMRTSSVLSYIGIWIATTVQLRNHFEKIGKIRSWILISLPLIYFMMQFQSTLVPFFSFSYNQNIFFNIFYTLFFSASRPVGGILFAIAFWILGSSTKNELIKEFMLLTSYGILIFFISNQAVVLTYGIYPPFGLIAISFLATGSYLLFLGIYSSSVTVAQDVALRKLLKVELKKYRFIENIGVAERTRIENRIVNKALNLGRKMEHTSGLPTSWEEEDINDYMKLYYKEIRKKSSNKIK